MSYLKKENDKINMGKSGTMVNDTDKNKPVSSSEFNFWDVTFKPLENYPKEQDPSGKPLNTPGAKADSGKLRPWLVLGSFSKALSEVTAVGTAGAKKYTEHGWKTVPNGHDRYLDAAIRHILEYARGKEIDDGPNGVFTHHLANAAWNILAVLELKLNEKSTS